MMGGMVGRMVAGRHTHTYVVILLRQSPFVLQQEARSVNRGMTGSDTQTRTNLCFSVSEDDIFGLSNSSSTSSLSFKHCRQQTALSNRESYQPSYPFPLRCLTAS